MKKIFESIKETWNTLTINNKVLVIIIGVMIIMLISGITDLVSGYNPSRLAEVLRPSHINELITYGWIKVGGASILGLAVIANYLLWNWWEKDRVREIQKMIRKMNLESVEDATIVS